MTEYVWKKLFDDAQSLADVDKAIGEVTRNLGCSIYAALWIHDAPGIEHRVEGLDNIPQSYMDYFVSGNRRTADPVMQHCKTSSLPIVWTRDFYAKNGMDGHWKEQAEHGLRSGACVAIHMPNHKHMAIGIERESESMGTPAEHEFIKSNLLLATIYAQNAMERIDPNFLRPPVQLTRREIDCLRWTMEGKTAWEVSKILSIAERTVVQHLQSATTTLGAANKTHAVIKAVQLGLVS